MSQNARIAHAGLRQKIMSAEEAAALIHHGVNVGMSGFTGAGYPKAVPLALAQRIEQANHDAGKEFRIGVWTGASTAPELDGALAKVGRHGACACPTSRTRPAASASTPGEMEYIDIHLSHVAQFVWFGFLGKLDVAVVEVAGILEDGRLIPVLLGRQQQDLARPGRQGDPGGQLLAARWAWRACTTSTTAPSCRRTASRSR